MIKQVSHNAFNAFEGVGQRTRLLKDFLLHVMAIRTQLCSTGVGLYGAHDTFHTPTEPILYPVLATLQVHHIAFFEVDNLIGHTGQRHCITGQIKRRLRQAQHQRRARARAHHAVRLVSTQHGNGIGPLEL